VTSATDIDLADAVTRQLDRMGASVRGRFVPPWAIADQEVQPVSAYLDPAHLETQMPRTIPVSDVADVDRRVIGSRFVREHVLGVVPPVLVGLAMGIGIDASAARAQSVWHNWHLRGSSAFAPHSLSVGTDAFALCAECHPSPRAAVTMVPTHEALRTQVWRQLFAEHLAPLNDTVLGMVKLSPRVLWASAAEAAGRVATLAAEQLSPEAARPFIDEVDALLAADRLPGISGANPIRGLLRWKDIGRSDFPHGLMLRTVCCMCFTLPDRRGQIYCGTCPLPSVETLIAVQGRPATDPLRAT
jgi:hypothetical protein